MTRRLVGADQIVATDDDTCDCEIFPPLDAVADTVAEEPPRS